MVALTANYVTAEIRPILHAPKMYTKDSSFPRYMIYGDILSDY